MTDALGVVFKSLLSSHPVNLPTLFDFIATPLTSSLGAG